MRKELELTQKIEQFLEGTLNADEKAAFEQQMADDRELQKEVQLQKEVAKGIERTRLKQAAQKAFYKYKLINHFLKWGLTGFSILTVATVIFYFNERKTEPVFNQITYENPIEQNKIDIQNNEFPDSSVTTTYQDSNLKNENRMELFPPKTLSVNENKSQFTNTPEQNQKTNTASEVKKDSLFLLNNKNSSTNSTFVKNQGINPKEIFLPETKITWLGLDFSNVKLIGNFAQFADAGVKSQAEIKNKYFKAWNNLIINERKKYDIGAALYRNNYVPYDMEYMNKLNDSINAENLFSGNSEDADHLKTNDIQAIVNKYQLKDKSGIGLVFIIESFDKSNVQGKMWVTFIDMASNTVLLTEKFSTKPGGGGLRNYWAKCFYDVIKNMENTKYQQWKQKYTK